jgi:predicted AAA+ superfamily ATPase
VGLASFLLDIQNPKQLSTHYLRGNLFENLIIMELLKKRFNNAQLSNLYFFRDSNKNEVDCILEDIESKAIEIKSAKSFSNSYIDSLKSFARFSDMKKGNGTVVYGGEENFTFKDFDIISWRNLERIYK